MVQTNSYALPQQALATDAPYADLANSDYARFQLLPNSQKRDYIPMNTSLFAINDLNKFVNSANPNYDSRAELDNASYKARLDDKSPNYSVESSSVIEPSDGSGVSTEKKALFDYNPETLVLVLLLLLKQYLSLSLKLSLLEDVTQWLNGLKRI